MISTLNISLDKTSSAAPVPPFLRMHVHMHTVSRDGIRLRTITGLFSWYQPDTIVHWIIDGRPYLFLANEGDSKQEARRVKDLLSLDANVFRNNTAVRQVRGVGEWGDATEQRGTSGVQLCE